MKILIMRKLRDDLLKHRGKYSRKSVITMASFLFAMFYVTALPIMLKEEPKEYVFEGFLVLVGATLGLTVADKFNPKNKKEEEEEKL